MVYAQPERLHSFLTEWGEMVCMSSHSVAVNKRFSLLLSLFSACPLLPDSRTCLLALGLTRLVGCLKSVSQQKAIHAAFEIIFFSHSPPAPRPPRTSELKQFVIWLGVFIPEQAQGTPQEYASGSEGKEMWREDIPLSAALRQYCVIAI